MRPALVGSVPAFSTSVFAPYTSITTNILFFDRTGATEETWFYRMDMPDGYKHFSKTKPMKAIFYSAFIIRKLIDCKGKVSDEVDKYKFRLKGVRPIKDIRDVLARG